MTRDHFHRFEVDRLYSISHLFPVFNGRRGIYVLEFANGQEYVGQAVDVVRRFAAHRRRWPDIQAIRFLAVPAASSLDEPEKRYIAGLRAGGVTLRNIRYSEVADDQDADIDFLIAPGEQHAWLNDEDSQLEDAPLRVEQAGQREKTFPSYERLVRSGHLPEVVQTLRTYMHLCVPRPRATELTFWALSAAPTTNKRTWPRLAVLSINSMETLVLGYVKQDPSHTWGFVNLSRRGAELSPAGQFRRRFRHRRFQLQETAYEASGPDVAHLPFDDTADLRSLLEDHESGIVTAARELNLRLMRKGPTMQWRWHCPRLADDVLGPDV